MKKLWLFSLLLYANSVSAQATSDMPSYFFVGKLSKKQVKLNSDDQLCTTAIASISIFEYKVIETNYPGYHDQYVIMIHPSAQYPGPRFFIRGKRYKMTVIKDKDTAFIYRFYNYNTKRRSPFFLSETVERYKK